MCFPTSILLIFIVERNRVTYPGLLEHLKNVSDWHTFGAYLLPPDNFGELESIRITCKGDVGECKKALFIKYMEVGDRSWNTVITALKKTDYKNIAKDISQALGL